MSLVQSDEQFGTPIRCSLEDDRRSQAFSCPLKMRFDLGTASAGQGPAICSFHAAQPNQFMYVQRSPCDATCDMLPRRPLRCLTDDAS
jgi:hypothetical protein